MNIMQRLYDNQVHHAALLYDAPGPHPDDQACQAKAQKPIWGGRLGPLGPGHPKLFLGFGLTSLVIRMGPWGIIQECCMMHLVIIQVLYDIQAS